MKFKKLFTIIVCLELISGCVYSNDYEYKIKKISDDAVKGSTTFENKIKMLREYVHNKMKLPESRRKSTGEPLRPENVYCLDTIERLNSEWGGWCDQQAVVFIRLAQKQGIITRLVWLYYNGDPSSRHTIVEALDGGRWVIVDTMFNLDLYNKDGKMASREDIANDITILLDSSSVKKLVKTDGPRWENDKEWAKMYTREERKIFDEQEAIERFLPAPNR